MTGEAVDRHRPAQSQGTDALLGVGGRYVVGFDGVAASRAALAWAASRALPRRPLQLLGVVANRGGAGAERLGDLVSEAAERLRDAHPGARVTTAIGRGSVVDALVLAAGAKDVLVVGSDKTGYASGRLFGLRSIQLTAEARGTVAVVPAVDLRLRTGVAVAIADLAGAAALARLGAREAVGTGRSLALVHAVPPGDAPARERALAVLSAARRAALEVDADLDVWAHVAQRHAADAILDLARDCALLVVGRSRAPSVLGVGQTLHEVLLNVNAPTVVVR